MTGAIPFVYPATCGCVFSAAGLRALSSPAEIPSPSTPPSDSKDGPAPNKQTLLCPQCSKPYDRLADVRTLNPGLEEEAVMREAMEARRAAKKAATKVKKRKAAEMQGEEADTTIDPVEHKKSKILPTSAGPRINGSVISVTRKVTESLAEEELKRKGKMSDAIASLYAPKSGANKKETFMTMGTFTRVSVLRYPDCLLTDTVLVCIVHTFLLYWISTLCLLMRLIHHPFSIPIWVFDAFLPYKVNPLLRQ